MSPAEGGGAASEPAAPLVVDPQLVDRVGERLEALRARISERTDREVRIVAVTKGHPVEMAAAALLAGCSDLGENYAQELLAKDRDLARFRAPGPGAPRWHFIGRLQSNKVRQLTDVVGVWHTVDRASLAGELAKRAPGARVLVQMDLAGIAGRGGCTATEVPGLVARCRELGLDVIGLMGVGVPGPPELSRAPFAHLVDLADDLGLPERSIGMSADLDVAVDEGATIVRVGTALVGPRAPRTR